MSIVTLDLSVAYPAANVKLFPLKKTPHDCESAPRTVLRKLNILLLQGNVFTSVLFLLSCAIFSAVLCLVPVLQSHCGFSQR